MSDYGPGDAVLVKWGSSFWHAKVLEKVGPRRWKIRYDGYDASSDEVVGPGRIRPRRSEDADEDLDDAALHDDDDFERELGPDAEGHEREIGQHASAFPSGREVDVLWQGRWYDARVKRVLGEHRWLVGYDGWSTSWDEIVGPERVRARTKKTRPMLGIVVLAIAVVTVLGGFAAAFYLRIPSRPSSTASSSAAVGDARSLAVGQPVQVEWQGRWYAATVLSVLSPVEVRIHYIGWSDRWDETVSIARVRRP